MVVKVLLAVNKVLLAVVPPQLRHESLEGRRALPCKVCSRAKQWPQPARGGTKVKRMVGSMQYHVLRNKGTERPGTGEYNKGSFAGGHFECRACGSKLYECAPLPRAVAQGQA